MSELDVLELEKNPWDRALDMDLAEFEGIQETRIRASVSELMELSQRFPGRADEMEMFVSNWDQSLFLCTFLDAPRINKHYLTILSEYVDGAVDSNYVEDQITGWVRNLYREGENEQLPGHISRLSRVLALEELADRDWSIPLSVEDIQAFAPSLVSDFLESNADIERDADKIQESLQDVTARDLVEIGILSNVRYREDQDIVRMEKILGNVNKYVRGEFLDITNQFKVTDPEELTEKDWESIDAYWKAESESLALLAARRYRDARHNPNRVNKLCNVITTSLEYMNSEIHEGQVLAKNFFGGRFEIVLEEIQGIDSVLERKRITRENVTMEEREKVFAMGRILRSMMVRRLDRGYIVDREAVARDTDIIIE